MKLKFEWKIEDIPATVLEVKHQKYKLYCGRVLCGSIDDVFTDKTKAARFYPLLFNAFAVTKMFVTIDAAKEWLETETTKCVFSSLDFEENTVD
jgi:hypothetical protein